MKRPDVLLLANAIMGQFLSGFASRIFIVSLPTIAATLHADIIGISWALIAYQLAGISLSVVFGRLGDVHGRYAIYGGGFAVMAASSLLCGIAPNVLALILSRAVQGIGAAMIASTARVLAIEAMPEGAEGRTSGYMTMAFHSGLLLGPPVGGVLIDLVGWRWVFFLLIPIASAGIALTILGARGRHTARRRGPISIDYVGAALLIALTIMLTVLLDERAARLVGAGRTGMIAVVFAATLAGFVVHETRATDPVVNLSLFRIRMFTFSVVSLLLVATATSMATFLMPFYLQDVLRLSPSFMGLVFLAAPVFTIVCANVSGLLTDRIGPRVPASIGVLVTLAAFTVGLLLKADSSWLWPAVLLGLTGLGAGFFNAPNQTAIIGSVPRHYRGFATGMVQTLFGIGSLLGISLAGVLLTVLFRYHSGNPDAQPGAGDPPAFVSSMNAVYVVCVALMVLALLASLMRGRDKVAASDVKG